MENLFNPQLANYWLARIYDMEKKYPCLLDSNENTILSTGERVLVSFFRSLAYWDGNIRLLVIDEADSFLDKEKRQFFNASLELLSSSVTIWKISHWDKVRSYDV